MALSGMHERHGQIDTRLQESRDYRGIAAADSFDIPGHIRTLNVLIVISNQRGRDAIVCCHFKRRTIRRARGIETSKKQVLYGLRLRYQSFDTARVIALCSSMRTDADRTKGPVSARSDFL